MICSILQFQHMKKIFLTIALVVAFPTTIQAGPNSRELETWFSLESQDRIQTLHDRLKAGNEVNLIASNWLSRTNIRWKKQTADQVCLQQGWYKRWYMTLKNRLNGCQDLAVIQENLMVNSLLGRTILCFKYPWNPKVFLSFRQLEKSRFMSQWLRTMLEPVSTSYSAVNGMSVIPTILHCL